MPVDTNTWRERTGLFNFYIKLKYSSPFSHVFRNSQLCFSSLLILMLITFVLYSELLVFHNIHFFLFDKTTSFANMLTFFVCDFKCLLILLSGDIELNPGPKRYSNLKVCHYNLNSLPSHSFAKVSSLQAYNAIHKFDIICLSETFLDSSISLSDPALYLDGYKIIRADHPMNIKRGGVCIYYKETLPLNVINISQLQESLVVEILYENKKCYLVTLYRSPSQNENEFDEFLKNFEMLLDDIYNLSPYFVILLGDFNAKLKKWNFDDIDTQEGTRIDAVTSSFALSQIISGPTHITANSASCIDLIFTSHPDYIINSGIHSSIHPNCHHQIIYAEINFKISFPPPYERLIWHYKRADSESIRRSLDNFNWEGSFANKSIDNQVEIFNSTILNIMSNYIPNEVITINDRDPPWITSKIKDKFTYKNYLLKRYLNNGKNLYDWNKVELARSDIITSINESKMRHYERLNCKLSNPNTTPKVYWSILKSLYCDKKIPVIPPLFYNNSFVTDFREKADLFNKFFANQCSLIVNASTLPDQIPLATNNFLENIIFSEDDILQSIRHLDANKSHGFDGISIRMLKLCDSSIVKPLSIIFHNCINKGHFPLVWKKGNITPIYKKNEKNLIENYRPISILPICGKLLERIIFNALYNFLENNNVLNVNQSGFRSGDSCTNQLLSITHQIFLSFNANPSQEVRGVFLDISKAFDKVWHDGLLFKLNQNGIRGKMLKIIASFLDNRYQRVVLNGQSSSWLNVKAGVPQGSILGPLLFLIYINDISNNLESDVKLFADDTSLFSTVFDPNISATTLNNDLAKINLWAYQWKMSFNPTVSKQAHEVIFSRKRNKVIHPNLTFNNINVKRVDSHKHLGLVLDDKLSFKDHLKTTIEKASKGINVLRKLRSHIPRSSLITIYKSFIRPLFDYADIIYDQPNNSSFIDQVESIQYNAALAITGAIRGSSRDKLYNELGIESLFSRRWFRKLCVFYKIFHEKSPKYLYNLIPEHNQFFNFRNRIQIPNIFCRTDFFRNSFLPSVIVEWNKLDTLLTSSETISIFRSSLLKQIRPTAKSTFNVSDNLGIQYLTRLRLGLSHLREHKFRHHFNDTLNPLCPCNLEVESVSHFFLHCHFFNNERLILMNGILNVDPDVNLLDDISISNLLLYGSNRLSNENNKKILEISVNYILLSKRFEGPLF